MYIYRYRKARLRRRMCPRSPIHIHIYTHTHAITCIQHTSINIYINTYIYIYRKARLKRRMCPRSWARVRARRKRRRRKTKFREVSVRLLHSAWLLYTVRDSYTYVGGRGEKRREERQNSERWVSDYYTVCDSYTQFVTRMHKTKKKLREVSDSYTVCDSYTQFVTHMHSSWLIYMCGRAWRKRQDSERWVHDGYVVRDSYV